MKINSPILCIGYGSIGRQHLSNMLALGCDDVTVVTNYPDNNWSKSKNNNNVKHYWQLQEALHDQKFEHAIICNPTSLHIQTLRTTLDAGIKNIYVEKPVSHNNAELTEIKQLIREKKAAVVVAYDLRFDPTIAKAKELIGENRIGKVVSLNAEVGQYLPDWRPSRDYRKSMSASMEKGGGVMLDLIHEFDYAYYLLGDVKTVACLSQHSGILEIETEDIANIILAFTSGATGSIHLDYLKPAMRRSCTIIGSEGMIQIDLVKNEIVLSDHKNNSERYSYPMYSRNDRLRDALSAFLEKNNDPRSTSFEEGCYSLNLVLAAKESSNKRIFVEPINFG